SRFPTKQDLFVAVIERRMGKVFREVAGFLPDDAPLKDTLREFGAGLLRVALSPEQIALVRVISMESSRFPILGQRFFETGPGLGQMALAEYLRGQIERGRLSNENPERMA